MTVEQKLQKVAETFKDEGISYLFHDWTRVNIAVDQMPLPVIVYSLPASGSLDMKNGFVNDNQNGLISFLSLTEFDFDSKENDCIISRMKQLALRFFSVYNQSGYFETVGGTMPYRVVYDMLDANVTGVMFEVSVKELDGICDKDVMRLVEDNINQLKRCR